MKGNGFKDVGTWRVVTVSGKAASIQLRSHRPAAGTEAAATNPPPGLGGPPGSPQTLPY